MHRTKNTSQVKRSYVVAFLWLWVSLGLTNFLASATSVSAGRRPVSSKNPQIMSKSARFSSKMDCRAQSDPVWIRNDCHEGFLSVISDRRVVALNSKINQHDDLVQLRMESCTSKNGSLWESVRTRLYSESQKRYICFNRRGHLRSVPKSRADRMGNLCAFYERALTSRRHQKYGHSNPPNGPYFNLQSAHNPRWYMGFGPTTPKGRRRHGLRYSPQGHALSLPRRMGRHDRRVRPKARCDFRFYKGHFRSRKTPEVSQSSPWAGIFRKIELQDHKENSVVRESYSKGASSSSKKSHQNKWRSKNRLMHGKKNRQKSPHRISRP